MSSLLFLSSDDFRVQQGTNGLLLCTDITHISVVLFYSTNCVYCQSLIPVFKKLPETVNGCQFGMINVSLNKRVVEQSQQTITAIKYVPLILLYVNGIPYMEYKGPYDLTHISNFIMETYTVIEKSLTFTKQDQRNNIYPNKEHPNIHFNAHHNIPAYSLGNPLYGDELRCYLNVSEYTVR